MTELHKKFTASVSTLRKVIIMETVKHCLTPVKLNKHVPMQPEKLEEIFTTCKSQRTSAFILGKKFNTVIIM
jgi:hypothetical protein